MAMAKPAGCALKAGSHRFIAPKVIMKSSTAAHALPQPQSIGEPLLHQVARLEILEIMEQRGQDVGESLVRPPPELLGHEDGPRVPQQQPVDPAFAVSRGTAF